MGGGYATMLHVTPLSVDMTHLQIATYGGPGSGNGIMNPAPIAMRLEPSETKPM
jgi:hypothetical protein